MIERYNFSEIEKKWQEKWEKEDTFKVTEDGDKEKYYVWRCSHIRRESFIWAT